MKGRRSGRAARSTPQRRASAASLERALHEIAQGRLPVERVLREALARSVRFRRWLDDEVASYRELGAKAVALREREGLPTTATTALREAVAAAHPNAIAVAIGVIDDDAGALVILPQEELDEARRASTPVVRSVRLAVDGRVRDVPVKLRHLAQGTRHLGERARPGAATLVEVDGRVGTLSAIAGAATPRAIFSGHVAGATGRGVVAILPDGQRLELGAVEHCMRTAEIDGASVPVDADLPPWVSSPAVEIRDLTSEDLRRRVTVRRARSEGDAAAHVSAIDFPVLFDDGQTVDGLVQLDRQVTRRGDSGAPVRDFFGALVGFVVGVADGHTVMIPARRVIDALV